jgi:hypothetical protein
MIPLCSLALHWRMVKCGGLVEFRRELGKKNTKKWKFAKNLVQNAEFLYHLEISLP